MKTFHKWLIAQEYRRDPVGDLAKYMILEKGLPKHKTKNSLLNHMINCGGGINETMTLHKAWAEYKNFRKLTK